MHFSFALLGVMLVGLLVFLYSLRRVLGCLFVSFLLCFRRFSLRCATGEVLSAWWKGSPDELRGAEGKKADMQAVRAAPTQDPHSVGLFREGEDALVFVPPAQQAVAQPVLEATACWAGGTKRSSASAAVRKKRLVQLSWQGRGVRRAREKACCLLTGCGEAQHVFERKLRFRSRKHLKASPGLPRSFSEPVLVFVIICCFGGCLDRDCCL